MIFRKILSFPVLLAFMVQTVIPAWAELLLPVQGQMVELSPAFNPPVLKGIKVYPDNPLRFDFILDQGDDNSSDDQIKIDSTRLIKYFLASLTIPEKDLWVNLSPYEKDRIVPEAFGQTEMGRDLLAQDYLLKQITASLLYPEGETGKKFWQKVYALAQEKYGTTDIPVDTFNKVWIVPEKAVVYENGKVGAAYVTESRLKVMLETDYLADEIVRRGGSQTHPAQEADESPVSTEYQSNNAGDSSASGLRMTSDLAKSVLREIVIPVLEQEVNEGKNFAQLRQVYQSLILATWYKKKIKQSLLSAVYVDRNKTNGVNISDPKEVEKIWGQYVEAFKKGAYSFAKRDSAIMKPEKQKILDKLEQARLLIPSDNLPDLPVDKALGVPGWYDFEHHIWAVGEDIRQIMVTYPILRKDKELQEVILEISCNVKAKRGRQSFIMLLGYKLCSVYACMSNLVKVGDNVVQGQKIACISNMYSPEFIPHLHLEVWGGSSKQIKKMTTFMNHYIWKARLYGVKTIIKYFKITKDIKRVILEVRKQVNILIRVERMHSIRKFLDSEDPLVSFPGLASNSYSVSDVTRLEVGVKNTGGIDFNSSKLDLKTQNAGSGLDFHIDPAMLQQMQNARGFAPVIINIHPMNDLKLFLGLTEPDGVTPLSA